MAHSLKSKYRDSKLSTKIALLNSILVFFVIVFILIGNDISIRRAAVRHATENAAQRNAIVTGKIDHLLDNAEDMSALIVYNDNVQKNLLLDAPLERLLREYPISIVMNTVVQNSAGISTILLLPNNGRIIASNRVNLRRLDTEEFRQAKYNMREAWGDLVWRDMHRIDYHVFEADRAAITLERNVVSNYTGDVVALLSVNINETAIAATYQGDLADSPETASIVVLNSQGQVVSSTDKSLLFTTGDTFAGPRTGEEKPALLLTPAELARAKQENGIISTVGGKPYLVTVATVDKLGWYVVRMDSLDVIYATNHTLNIINVGVGLLALVLAAIAAKLISQVMMRPVVQLSRIMAGPEETMLYNDTVIPTGNDEAGVLVTSFKRMQLRLQVLIERTKYEGKLKTQLNMSSLQTQINPHFLYNTLESVCALMQLGRIDDASKMLKSVEMFYRGSLSKGSNVISIRDEVFVAQQYLLIQSYRYDGDLNVDFQISEDILDSRIPKLTLQPILENAIYHGLKNGGRDGVIRISEEHTDDRIVLIIRDNGDGFVPDKGILAPRPGKRGGFGLYNTDLRIKSYFGEDYGLSLFSTPGMGTTVQVVIPNRQKHIETDG